VLPEPASAPLRLDEPTRRMVELTSARGNAYTYNLWQELVGISALDAHLLPMLDGTRDGDALVEELMARNRANLLHVELDGKVLSDEAQVRQVFSEHVAALPQRLEQMELLRVG
jgi:methyltransferase-like protein